MSPARMIEKLQKERDSHSEWSEEQFKDYAIDFIDENDDLGFITMDGEQVAVVDYVLNSIEI